jgi:rhodanese-related sulfurtransferase
MIGRLCLHRKGFHTMVTRSKHGPRCATAFIFAVLATSLPAVSALKFLSSADLYALLEESDARVQILDVRTDAEFAEGHIEGAAHVPHDQVTGWPEGLDPSTSTAVICKSGPRALHAGVLLDPHTDAELLVVSEGGVLDWPALGGTLVTT